MENQNPVPNTAVQETPSSQVYTAPHIDNLPPKKPFFTGRIILLIVILLILLGAGETYLALNSKPKPAPTAPQVAPTPSPTPIDETANWKTYTKFKYSFRLPPKYNPLDAEFNLIKDSSSSSASSFLQYSAEEASKLKETREKAYYNSLSVIQSPYLCPSPSGATVRNTVIVGNVQGQELIGDSATYADPFFGDVIVNVYKAPYCYKIYFLRDPNSLSQSEKFFNQILSTFKFLDTSPTPTCRPRPACLDTTPRCLIPETSDMCPKAVVCTQDAKLCPDGKTYVSRQGPNCEFALCPGQ